MESRERMQKEWAVAGVSCFVEASASVVAVGSIAPAHVYHSRCGRTTGIHASTPTYLLVALVNHHYADGTIPSSRTGLGLHEDCMATEAPAHRGDGSIRHALRASEPIPCHLSHRTKKGVAAKCTSSWNAKCLTYPGTAGCTTATGDRRCHPDRCSKAQQHSRTLRRRRRRSSSPCPYLVHAHREGS